MEIVYGIMNRAWIYISIYIDAPGCGLHCCILHFLSCLELLCIPDTVTGVLIELFLICDNILCSSNWATRASISPWVTLLAMGPSRGSLQHCALCIIWFQSQ